jgi:hypothetical protein
MSDNQQLTDSIELRELHDSLAGLALPERPRLETIAARRRAHRRRRLGGVAGLSVAGVAAGTALVLGLTGVLGSAQPAPAVIRTAAFVLTSHPNGTDTLTLKPGELFDAAALQSDLQKFGIAAKVTSGSFCNSDPAPSGFSNVVTFQPAGPFTIQLPSGTPATITIDPSAMPAGTELSFGDFQVGGEQQADLALINSGSYTCSSTPPGPAGPVDGMQFTYGGPSGS